MNVHYSTDKIIGPHGDLVRAKRDKHGDIILYVDAIAFDYADQQQGIKAYLHCFKEWNEDDHPRDENGEWTDAGGGDSGGSESGGGSAAGFVSPNVKTDLNFSGAVKQLNSPQQAALHEASGEIDSGLGIESNKSSIIGAWADGAENSVMVQSRTDWDRLVTSTAMKGHLADQKSVLVFKEQQGGQAVLASFNASGKLEDIHKNLLQDGLAFHTLVPSKDGAIVYVADLDGSALDAIKKGAERYGSEVTVQFGRAEFIGDTSGEGTDREQRDRAREIYGRVIDQSKVEGSAKVWADVRDRWSKASKKLRAALGFALA